MLGGGAVLGLVERRHVARLEQLDVKGELVAQALRQLAIANPDLGLDGATSELLRIRASFSSVRLRCRCRSAATGRAPA
jgi:hypothetical protein